MADFQLNDPVTISTTGGDSSTLEGVVAHLGPVQFAPGTDWIGIRLTGASVGKGKNNGTVKGTQYFDVAENCGMFTKKVNVTKRELNRLEKLRLKRELAEKPSASSIPTTTTRSTRSTRSSTGTAASKTDTSPKAASPKRPTSAATGGGSSKLAELRAKREAATKGRSGTSSRPSTSGTSGASAKDSTTSTPTPSTKKDEATDDDVEDNKEDDKEEQEDVNTTLESPSKEEAVTSTTTTAAAEEENNTPSRINLQSATPGYRAELTRLQNKISQLQNDLKKKTTECTSLQSSLDFMSKGAEQSTHDAVRMYAMGALALTEAKSTPGGGGKQGSAATPRSGKGGRRSLEADMKEADDDNSDDNDSDEEEDGDENDDGNEEVVNQAAAAVSQALVERNDELTKQLSDLTSANTNLQSQLSEAEEKISNVVLRFEQTTENYNTEKQERSNEQKTYQAEKAVLTSQVSSLERELQVLQERVSDKSSSQDHSHVTLAKLRAELTSYQRKNEELNNEKMELENTMEELVLDKEQIGQEKEMIEDELEECKIDLESAQLELEDARAQLEEGQAAMSSVADGGAAEPGEGEGEDRNASFSSNADAQDVTRSLTLQNTRLRTALIRLREQSEFERNDLQRQLKAYQSDSTNKEELQTELDTLKSTHATTLVEVRELKDIIDQTSALEETIETLSDKVWNLEENNAALERTVRELEEELEVQAEMEEVQTEELKMVMRDLEGRDALVGNLEEAIRMQRRREEDFQRYVSEFRTSIETLKQEKAALLALTDDNQGEKSELLATSKKALAQAAQLASDAAEARQRSSEAAFQMIAARSATYLSQRLETLLPSGVVSAELSAVKGEMSLAKVADKAAVSLTAVEEVFNKAIEKGSSGVSEFNALEEGASMVLSDASTQQIGVMTHQALFASMTIEAATDALRLMAAGQWPELLSQEMSTDLGSVVVHSIADLDLTLSEQLKLLKTEGVLSPFRSSLSDLDQSVRNTRLALFSATDESGNTVIPENWKPPGMEALKSLSLGRFACLGATAVISSAVSPMEDTENEPPPATPQNLADVLTKAKQSCDSMIEVSKAFSGLQLSDTDTLESLADLSSQYQTSSLALFESVKTIFEGQTITSNEMNTISVLLEQVLSATRSLSALARKAELDDADSTSHHYLSAEYGDSWGGVTEIVSQVRSVDGDSDDVNYLMRARAIENQLTEAVENEPKLDAANTKIASLEKSMSSRTREIQMQNSRISELEALLARAPSEMMSPRKSGSRPSSGGGSPVHTADTQKLKDEVKMLQEAVDVMQQQADEYEKEIKSLKDKLRPSRGVRTAGGRVTPKKSPMDLEATLNQLSSASKSTANSSSRDVLLESISLETALFRPALGTAVQSANFWKTKAMGSALSKLSPLNVPTSEKVQTVDATQLLNELALAQNEARSTKASFSIVDLSNKGNVSSRDQLIEEQQKEEMVSLRLRTATELYLKSSTKNDFSTASFEGVGKDYALGRISVPCREGGYVTSRRVNNAELRNLHSYLVQ